MSDWSGKRVFVYFDLHHKCWSLKSLETGRVLNYRPLPGGGREKILVREVGLDGVTFKVSEAGRQRVLDTGVKNIHAGLVGTVVPVTDKMRKQARKGVKYNPKLYATFVDAATLAPVYEAPFAVMLDRQVLVPS
ncbi:MAG: hypothetical protein ACREGR_00245 [Minisyncoccia bacterium]